MKDKLKKIPGACQSVKCMQPGCPNQAMHKVGEENIFNQTEERDDYESFNQHHNLTTYLCEHHFAVLMKREEYYGDVSKYSPNQSFTTSKMIDGLHEILLVWKGANQSTSGRVVNNGIKTIVYLQDTPNP